MLLKRNQHDQITCDHCGKLFVDRQRTKKSQKTFCSRKCHHDFRLKQSEIMNGIPKWAHDILKQTKKRAAKKGIEFSISPHEMADLITRSDGKCEVTGIQLVTDRTTGRSRRPWYPSIDRVNNDLGYTQGNIRIVCVAANIAMNEWGEDVLLTMAISMLAALLPKAKEREKYLARANGKRIGAFLTHEEAIKATLKMLR